MNHRSRAYQMQTAENALQIAIEVIDDARQHNQALIAENRQLRRENLALKLVKDEPPVEQGDTDKAPPVAEPEVEQVDRRSCYVEVSPKTRVNVYMPEDEPPGYMDDWHDTY